MPAESSNLESKALINNNGQINPSSIPNTTIETTSSSTEKPLLLYNRIKGLEKISGKITPIMLKALFDKCQASHFTEFGKIEENGHTHTPWHYIAARCCDRSIIEAFFNHPCFAPEILHSRNNQELTPLMIAVDGANMPFLEAAATNKHLSTQDWNELDIYGRSLLYRACIAHVSKLTKLDEIKKFELLISFLIKQGVSILHRDQSDNTVISYAVQENKLPLLKILAKHNLSKEIWNQTYSENKINLLFIAGYFLKDQTDEKMYQFLWKRVDFNHKETQGITIVYMAMGHGNWSFLQFAAKKINDPLFWNQLTTDGCDVLHACAYYTKNENIIKNSIKLLLTKGAQLNFDITKKKLHLHVAALNQNIAFLCYFLNMPIQDEAWKTVDHINKTFVCMIRESWSLEQINKLLQGITNHDNKNQLARRLNINPLEDEKSGTTHSIGTGTPQPVLKKRKKKEKKPQHSTIPATSSNSQYRVNPHNPLSSTVVAEINSLQASTAVEVVESQLSSAISDEKKSTTCSPSSSSIHSLATLAASDLQLSVNQTATDIIPMQSSTNPTVLKTKESKEMIVTASSQVSAENVTNNNAATLPETNSTTYFLKAFHWYSLAMLEESLLTKLRYFQNAVYEYDGFAIAHYAIARIGYPQVIADYTNTKGFNHYNIMELLYLSCSLSKAINYSSLPHVPNQCRLTSAQISEAYTYSKDILSCIFKISSSEEDICIWEDIYKNDYSSFKEFSPLWADKINNQIDEKRIFLKYKSLHKKITPESEKDQILRQQVTEHLPIIQNLIRKIIIEETPNLSAIDIENTCLGFIDIYEWLFKGCETFSEFAAYKKQYEETCFPLFFMIPPSKDWNEFMTEWNVKIDSIKKEFQDRSHQESLIVMSSVQDSKRCDPLPTQPRNINSTSINNSSSTSSSSWARDTSSTSISNTYGATLYQNSASENNITLVPPTSVTELNPRQ